MTDQQLETVPNTQETGFSADYVKQLREEAASWRTKFRELESSIQTKDVEIALAQKGIKAKASWIEIKEGQSVADAIESFAKEYPTLIAQPTETTPQVETTQKSIQTKPVVKPFTPNTPRVSNIEVKDLSQIIANKSLDDIKNDPNSRSQMRDWYQSALRSRQ